MLRSLFAGITGLRQHQTMMDVTGNNIANVNTAGYKSSTTLFQETMSQMLKAPGAPQGARAGNNPAQVGLGVQLAGISQNFGQGAAQLTGRATDVAIQGDGFFVVAGEGEQLFTRAGSFTPDTTGRLSTVDGLPVQGWTANAAGAINPNTPPGDIVLPAGLSSLSVSPTGVLVGTLANGTKQPVAQLEVATFNNPGGLEKAGGTMWRTSVNSGAAAAGVAGDQGRGTLLSGSLEMSNVDLAQEFTNLIIAQRGFQANSRIITASDEILQDLVNLKR